MIRRTALLVAVCAAIALPGCATRFSPDTIRDEIVRQRGGEDPLGVFELNLGRFTTMLLRSAIAGDGGEVPFAGVRELQLAVFESPGDGGPALDATRIPVRGWEPVVRAVDGRRSGLVLVRQGTIPRWSGRGVRSSIGDLVIVASGPERVVYARLRGGLDPELPTALGELLRTGGPDELRRVLTELVEGE